MTQDPQQPIKNLLNPSRAGAYLAERAPAFAQKHELKNITVTPLKQIITRTVGEGFHHVVIRYDAPSFGEYPLFCTAYSKGKGADDDQSREHAFRALAFLARHGFKHSRQFLPKPLFFDRELKAFFYQGMDGKNLRAILKNPKNDIAAHLEQTAQWVAQLHRTPTAGAREILKDERIAAASPGLDFFERVIGERAPEHKNEVMRLFRGLAAREERLAKERAERWVIHGDLHPENVVVNQKTGQVSVTDFTDIALGDWAKDIGSFLAQLGFMSLGFRSPEQTRAESALFADAYAAAAGRTLDAEARERIALYRSWTALRNAIYFLTKRLMEKAEAKTALSLAREQYAAITQP